MSESQSALLPGHPAVLQLGAVGTFAAPHRIVRSAGAAGRGRPSYAVHFRGEFLLDHHDPEHVAARELQLRGLTGRLEVWSIGSAVPCFVLDIQRAAELTVSEGRIDGPKLARWRPFAVVSGGEDHDADCRATVERSAAMLVGAAG